MHGLSGKDLSSALDTVRGRTLAVGTCLVALAAVYYTARNADTARQGHVTDRYTKAIEQLGSDRLDVRVGGIFANLRGATLTGSQLSGAKFTKALLIGADLSDAGLRQADLSGAGLSQANLSRALLEAANLREATLLNADLTDTDLRGAAGPAHLNVASTRLVAMDATKQDSGTSRQAADA